MHILRCIYRFVPIKQSRNIATKTITNEKDVFGTLSESGRQKLAIHSAESFIHDDPDGYDKEEFNLEPRKNEFYYKHEITKYARQGRLGIRKALQLFERMKSNDHITPTVQNFSPLIYGCAKVGYTKRAFELYEESIKYVGKPTKSVVTCLLNSCAESPFPEYGLKRLDWLMNHLKFEQIITLNKIQYHCAIKAYGKLGKLEEASKLVKEMIDNGLYPDVDTFNMLLIGCATDTQSGSILALRLFKRMKLYGIRPTTVTYRLLLRCIRDCGVGSAELVRQTLGELPAMTSLDQRLIYKKLKKKQKEDKFEDFEWAPLFNDLSSSIKTALKSSQPTGSAEVLVQSDTQSNLINQQTLISYQNDLQVIIENSDGNTLPNLLSGDHLNLITKIEDIKTDRLKSAVQRFMLFGGMHGYLEQMDKDECTPDSKTFSLILECIKPDKHNHLEYLRLAKDYSIERDLLFYDLLIRHACKAYQDKARMQNALQLMDDMHQDGIRPNISTFESLAMGCDSLKEASQLLRDMDLAGFIPSDLMLVRLFNIALRKSDFRFMIGLLDISQKYKLRPTKHLVDKLELKRVEVHDLIVKKERGLVEDDQLPVWLNEDQIRNFDKFNRQLGKWLRSVELVEEEHPWQQFNAKRLYKKEGLHEFVQNFKTLIKVKNESLKEGGKMGNLMKRASQYEKKEN